MILLELLLQLLLLKMHCKANHIIQYLPVNYHYFMVFYCLNNMLVSVSVVGYRVHKQLVSFLEQRLMFIDLHCETLYRFQLMIHTPAICLTIAYFY